MGVSRLLWSSLGSLPCLALAALATLPVAALELWQGWDFLSPQAVVAETLWLPLACWCQIALLARLGAKNGLNAPPVGLGTLASVLGAQILLSLRFCVVALGWALPALLCLSLLGVEKPASRWLIAALALGGAIPTVLWVLRCLFAPAVVLWQGLPAASALDESARLSQGKLKSVIIPMLLWNGFSFCLESASQGQGALAWPMLPLSLLISQAVMLWAYLRLTL